MALVHEPLLRYAARRCDPASADDLVADTLLVLWRRLDEIPAGAEVAWSYRVAGNSLANLRRGGRRQLRLITRIAAHHEAFHPEPPLPDGELHNALRSLRPVDQELLRLWGWEQLSPSEIALVLDLTPNAVSIRLHRAKQRLAAALGGRKNHAGAGHEGHEDQEMLP